MNELRIQVVLNYKTMPLIIASSGRYKHVISALTKLRALATIGAPRTSLFMYGDLSKAVARPSPEEALFALGQI